MFRIFCCRTRHSNRVEVDEVTDSLEKCLTIESGAREFKLFLEKNHFDEESTTLAFAFKCQNIAAEIQRLSPFTRARGLPTKIENDIRNLCEMADNMNFDLDQMNTLRNLNLPDTDIKRRKKFISSALHLCKYLQMLKQIKSLPVVLFLALLYLQLCSQGNARHYFVENSEVKISKTSSENLNFEPGYHECYIMVQEVKKIGGQCVKIRENFQGCVAGSLMDPFHQDCL